MYLKKLIVIKQLEQFEANKNATDTKAKIFNIMKFMDSFQLAAVELQKMGYKMNGNIPAMMSLFCEKMKAKDFDWCYKQINKLWSVISMFMEKTKDIRIASDFQIKNIPRIRGSLGVASDD